VTSRRPGKRARPFVALGVIAVALGWLLAVPMEASFSDFDGGVLPYAPDSWSPAYEWVYETAGEPLGMTEYYFWGKFAFLLYVAGLILLRALPRGSGRASRVGRRLLQVGLVAGLVGDLLGYWSGWGHEDMTELTSVGFIFLEVPGLLLLVIGLVVSGIGLWRDGLRPRWTPWLLVLGGLGAVPFSGFVIGYLPHGVLVPVLGTLTVVVAVSRWSLARRTKAERRERKTKQREGIDQSLTRMAEDYHDIELSHLGRELDRTDEQSAAGEGESSSR
jgi:hypothetical protein